MLDYKDIIIRHFVLNQSGREIARELGVSKTGVNDFLHAFKQCESLHYPLPEGITNYGIATQVYGKALTAAVATQVMNCLGMPRSTRCSKSATI